MIVLVELETFDLATGKVCTLRLSEAPYCTRRSDSPPDTPYLDLLVETPQMSRSAFTDGRTGGAIRRQGGRIVLANADGRFDYLLSHAIDGRPVTIRTGPEKGAYPDDYPVWMVGALSHIEIPDEGRLYLVMRDAMAIFEKPLLKNHYAGDNVAPNGVEGTPEDLKDRPKPRVFGQALNVPAVCVNTSKLIFQVNDGPVADIPAVYDRGNGMTRGADYADLADLMAHGPAAGGYRVWRAGGLLRTGSSPDTLTADVMEGATAADCTTAQVIARIAAMMGHDAISAEDMTALDAVAPGVVGIWLDSETDALSVMDRLAAGIGAYCSIDAYGVLRFGRLDAPEEGVPVGTLHPAIISDCRLQRSRDAGGGLPVPRVTVRYGINWLPMDRSGVAGVVDEVRRAWLTQPDRVSAWEDETVTVRHPLAEEMERESLLVYEADAQAEAARLGALYGVPRRLYRLTLARPEAVRRLPALDIGVLVRLEWPRYGLESGGLFRVIGIESRPASDTLVLDVWG